jgi:type II secretion system protein N
MRNTKAIIFYAGFTCLTMLFFLYWLFPSDLLRQYVETLVNRINPELSVSIEEIELIFPPGLSLSTVDVRHKDYAMVRVDAARIAPRLLSIFGDSKAVKFTLETSDGTADGVAVVGFSEEVPRLSLTVDIAGIQLNQLAALRGVPDYIIAGILDGRIDFTSKDGRTGNGQASLGITKCRIEPLNPVFNVERIEFRSIDTDLALTPKRVQIRKFDAKGRQLNGKVTGSIYIRAPYDSSRLNLSGIVRPHPEFTARLKKSVPIALLGGRDLSRQGLPFKISGTVAKPGFSLK